MKNKILKIIILMIIILTINLLCSKDSKAAYIGETRSINFNQLVERNYYYNHNDLSLYYGNDWRLYYYCLDKGYTMNNNNSTFRCTSIINVTNEIYKVVLYFAQKNYFHEYMVEGTTPCHGWVPIQYYFWAIADGRRTDRMNSNDMNQYLPYASTVWNAWVRDCTNMANNNAANIPSGSPSLSKTTCELGESVTLYSSANISDISCDTPGVTISGSGRSRTISVSGDCTSDNAVIKVTYNYTKYTAQYEKWESSSNLQHLAYLTTDRENKSETYNVNLEIISPANVSINNYISSINGSAIGEVQYETTKFRKYIILE